DRRRSAPYTNGELYPIDHARLASQIADRSLTEDCRDCATDRNLPQRAGGESNLPAGGAPTEASRVLLPVPRTGTCSGRDLGRRNGPMVDRGVALAAGDGWLRRRRVWCSGRSRTEGNVAGLHDRCLDRLDTPLPGIA